MNALEQARWMDRYLEGSLSGIELQQFMEKLEQDVEFRHRVSLRNLMIEGIRQAADEELQARIEASIRYRKPRVPVGLKLLATFLLVTTAGIVLWNYTGVNSDSDKAFLRLGWLKQRKAEERTIVPAPPVAKAPANKPSAEVEPAEEKTGAESVLPIDSGQTAEGRDTIYDAAGEIVVRKDQLLISMDLHVSSDEPGENAPTLEDKALERLNPAAGLVKSESREPTIATEFWISPVNYRGYRLLDNKLILYGIESPDRVSLLRSNDRLLLKYGNELFILSESEAFQPYPRAQEAARSENR
ncbi:MAG: hypothetical protein ACO1G7_07080 [Bacteroidota bacterium]